MFSKLQRREKLQLRAIPIDSNNDKTKVNENIHSSESDERLTHAQTTSTRPSCSPNRYKSENSAWDQGYAYRCYQLDALSRRRREKRLKIACVR